MEDKVEREEGDDDSGDKPDELDSGDLPDHTLVVLRRRLAPVAGSATVCVVVLTPVRFDP